VCGAGSSRRLARTDSFVTRVGGERALAVERYDRHLYDDLVTRTHQEDLAQALGLDTGDPERKFQRGRAIPSLAAAAAVLEAGGSDPDDLARLVTFNHVVGNTDFHAKNIAFVRAEDGTAHLAPAYDVSMHLHHRTRDPLSALDVNGARHMHTIGITDVVAEATSWGVPEHRARTVVRDLLERLTVALEDVDVTAHPGVPEQAYAIVTKRVTSALASLSEPEPAKRPRQSGRRGPRARG
jgi:serine/threonine-protein kinase HipA